MAAIFFCAMGTFAGVAALYLTSTPFRPFAHQAAEIVLFCLLFAIALFAVIALFVEKPSSSKQKIGGDNALSQLLQRGGASAASVTDPPLWFDFPALASGIF